MKKIMLLIVSLVLFIGCNKLTEGYVIEKHYEPTTTSIMLLPMTISTGKTTTTVMIPHTIVDYEDYCVTIKGWHKDEERIETIYVTKSQYECLSMGDKLKVTEDCSYTDGNNEKHKN